MDYEIAIHRAVEAVWPSSSRRGCQLHYKKALLRKVKQFDLWEEYLLQDSPIREHIAMVMVGAIAFVPEGEVPRVWRQLKPVLPADLAEFAAYYESTWIGTSTTDPLFYHDMWNQHDAGQLLLPRSTNIAEGWHHGFHSLMSCSEPTVSKFLDCLKAEQSLTDVKLTKRLL